MSKVKLQYMCDDCGATASKWSGRCGSCHEWNTIKEVSFPDIDVMVETPRVQLLSDISLTDVERMPAGDTDIDRLLGGGIVPGSLILIGGEPGAGKSTLSLQIGARLGRDTQPVLVVSGEESCAQVAERARRIGVNSNSVSIAAATEVSAIASLLRDTRPRLAIIDSVQTLVSADSSSAAGSVNCVRECVGALAKVAKELNVALILIGHVTKDGSLAGPRTLEHLVDVVLLLEGDRHHELRFLRSVKNRFGATGELVALTHEANGMKVVPDPAALLLGDKRASHPGSVLGALVDGRQAFVVEVQALCSRTVLPSPRRGVDGGLDMQRLHRLLAVIDQHGGVKAHEFDVFASVVGNLACDDQALDLPLALALASARGDFVVPHDVVAIGEVGLGGDIRSVSSMATRLRVVSQLGFKRAIVPAGAETVNGLELIHTSSFREALVMVDKRTK